MSYLSYFCMNLTHCYNIPNIYPTFSVMISTLVALFIDHSCNVLLSLLPIKAEIICHMFHEYTCILMFLARTDHIRQYIYFLWNLSHSTWQHRWLCVYVCVHMFMFCLNFRSYTAQLQQSALYRVCTQYIFLNKIRLLNLISL